MLKEKECVVCGKTFMPLKAIQKTCSEECRRKRILDLKKQNRKHIEHPVLICPVCGKSFVRIRTAQVNCSNKCSVIAREALRRQKVAESPNRLYTNVSHKKINEYEKWLRDKDKRKMDDVTKISIEAHGEGKSYGQYMAEKYLQTLPKIDIGTEEDRGKDE